jgi:hypothetical protein
MDREAEVADVAGDSRAPPSSPQPAIADVATANVSSEANAALNLFKKGTK